MGLVISRKQQQEFNIGTDIKIKVIRVRGNTVRLLIDAPKEIPVTRPESEERKRVA